MGKFDSATQALSIYLEARAPRRRCHRAYAIELVRDLFGVWLVEMTYGRIGTQGRTKVRSFAQLSDAHRQVTTCLRRRATAPQRIGVAYEIVRSRHLNSRP
jgi:predicted DNA-binding WGR domain protein